MKILGAMPPQIEAPKAPSGVVYGDVSPPQPTRGSGVRRELPHGVRGGVAPAGNTFWRIFKATERSFLHLYADAANL